MEQSQRLRIAVGGISLESNDFVPFTAERTEFADAGFLAEDGDVLALEPSDTEIGGALGALAAADDVDVVPLLAARGVSSGRLSAACYDELRSGLIERLP